MKATEKSRQILGESDSRHLAHLCISGEQGKEPNCYLKEIRHLGVQKRTAQDSRRHVKATRMMTDAKGSGREGSHLTGLGMGMLSEGTQGMKELV